MIDTKNLDVVDRKEKAATLSNIIIDCMIKNNMTLQNLEEACKSVERMYARNATVGRQLTP